MDLNYEEIIKKMMNESDRLWDAIRAYKSDVVITCKITFKDVPTVDVRSSDFQDQLDVAVEGLEDMISTIPNAKTSVRVTIKDKEPKKSIVKGDDVNG